MPTNHALTMKHLVGANGLRLAAVDCGPENTTPIVLIAGWPQTTFAWRHVQQRLADSGIRSIAVDPPGLGQSDLLSPGASYDTASVADIMAKAISHAGWRDYVLVGHDVGAWIGFAWAARHAADVRKVCLSEAGIPGVVSDAIFALPNASKIFQFYFNAVPELPEILTRGREKAFLAWFFNNKSAVKGVFGPAELEEYARSYSEPARMSAGFEYYRAVPVNAEQNRDTRLSVPVLAVGGEKALGDGMAASLRERADAFAGEVLENCGHYLADEAPKPFADLIARFAGAR